MRSHPVPLIHTTAYLGLTQAEPARDEESTLSREQENEKMQLQGRTLKHRRGA